MEELHRHKRIVFENLWKMQYRLWNVYADNCIDTIQCGTSAAAVTQPIARYLAWIQRNFGIEFITLVSVWNWNGRKACNESFGVSNETKKMFNCRFCTSQVNAIERNLEILITYDDRIEIWNGLTQSVIYNVDKTIVFLISRIEDTFRRPLQSYDFVCFAMVLSDDYRWLVVEENNVDHYMIFGEQKRFNTFTAIARC